MASQEMKSGFQLGFTKPPVASHGDRSGNRDAVAGLQKRRNAFFRHLHPIGINRGIKHRISLVPALGSAHARHASDVKSHPTSQEGGERVPGSVPG